jgi:hypothetical protein
MPAEEQKLSAGHVHHERAVPAGSGFQQHRPQPLGVADIDFGGRRHHGHAVDHLNGIPVACHLHPTSRPDAHDSAANPGAWMGWSGPGGPARTTNPLCRQQMLGSYCAPKRQSSLGRYC